MALPSQGQKFPRGTKAILSGLGRNESFHSGAFPHALQVFCAFRGVAAGL